MLAILAALSSSSLVDVLVMLVVAGLICWLLWWFIGYIGLPEPFNKVARVIIALFALLICLNALLSLGGRGFISW